MYRSHAVAMPIKLETPARPEILLTRDIGDEVARAGLRAGGLIRVYRGAYVRVIDDEPRWQHRQRIALARAVAIHDLAKSDCVISHGSAALLHGCWIWQLDARTHTLQATRTGMRPEKLRRRHLLRGDLNSDEVVRINGVRATSLERTILDCARHLRPGEALVIADSALRILLRPDREDRASIEAELREIRRSLAYRVLEIGGHGVKRALALIEHASPWSESPYESVVRWIAISRGLPPPILQYPIDTQRGRYYADMAWELPLRDGRRRTLLVEVDGQTKYSSQDADGYRADFEVLRAEKLREDAIREVPGIRMLRLLSSEIHNPDAVFSRIQQALPAAVFATLRPVRELIDIPGRRSR